MTLSVARHRPLETDAWDDFVRASRNGTFLLERAFMDYHRHRFEDHSLVIRDAAGRITGLLPAHETAKGLASHNGLTYGGLVVGAEPGCTGVVAMLDAACAYMRARGMETLEYKTIPWIYHRLPAEDDRYALFRAGARLHRRDVLAVVAREGRIDFQDRRNRGILRARRNGVEVRENRDLGSFWPVLEHTLRSRHGVVPVHSLAEIEGLHRAFPAHIRLFTAHLDGSVIAGVLVFETPRVAHCQYIAADESGRAVGALDAVFDHLLASVYHDKPFFDFGGSNEDNGRVLNGGLMAHKEGFGARSVVHDHYVLEL